MQIVVLADKSLKEELLNDIETLTANIVWIENFIQLDKCQSADAIIDLVFEKSHIEVLQSLLPRLIIINSVENSLKETNSSFIRINGWPTLLKSTVIEASVLNDDDNKKTAEEIFSLFNKKLEWLPDEVGFITPRVISMIINEAFIALKEGVSTKEEIDTAMKLGTNYPFGPFEWAEKIGVGKIERLLNKLKKGSDTP